MSVFHTTVELIDRNVVDRHYAYPTMSVHSNSHIVYLLCTINENCASIPDCVKSHTCNMNTNLLVLMIKTPVPYHCYYTSIHLLICWTIESETLMSCHKNVTKLAFGWSLGLDWKIMHYSTTLKVTLIIFTFISFFRSA